MSPAPRATPTRVLLATRNPGKLRELAPLFAALGVEVDTLLDAGLEERAEEEALEVFETFAENALAKARYFHARSGGRLVLAEDSGLCVGALAGAPGVLSKRWAADAGGVGQSGDAANLRRLLRELDGVADRTAWFACAACLVWSEGSGLAIAPVGLIAEGKSVGRILEAPEGTGGFGYDPVFWSDELGACFAGVDRARKASVSHRSRAVRGVWERYVDGVLGTSFG